MIGKTAREVVMCEMIPSFGRFNLAAFLLKCSNLCRDAWLEVDLDPKGVTRKNARMVQLAVDLYRTSAEILVKLAKDMRSKVESFLEGSDKDDKGGDAPGAEGGSAEELKRLHGEAQKNLRELEQARAVSLKLKASFLKHFFSAFPLSTRCVEFAYVYGCCPSAALSEQFCFL